MHVKSKTPWQVQNKRQTSDIQHSTRLYSHQVQHQPIQKHTSTDKTDEEAIKRWVGLAPPPVQVALPFLWVTVLLKFARNWRSQCAKTCDCHSAPWPMGGMNGTVTTRLVEEQQKRGVAPFFSSHREIRLLGRTHPYYTLFWSLAQTCHIWRHQTRTEDTGQGHNTWNVAPMI